MSSYFGFDAYNIDRGSEPFVFISYKNEDCDRVAVYARYLHDNGINVWYDNGLKYGSDWESYLMSIIEKPECKAVLLFLSSKVASSTVIPLETTQARICKKPTVAIHLEGGLDIENLLNKAIKVYVEQRQSVNAYNDSEDSICKNILRAAREALNNTEQISFKSNDQLWDNAQIFLNNAERSGSANDISSARSYLEQMTQQSPADYRGWLGLAVCECLPSPSDIDSGLLQLYGGAKYYSYVVSAGADPLASDRYTRTKSRLWERIINLFEGSLEQCADNADVQKHLDWIQKLEKCQGHTSSRVKKNFENLVIEVNDLVGISEEMDEQAVSECVWKDISETEVCLAQCNSASAYFEIPENADGKKVTRIAAGAFAQCSTLKCVTIPHGVKKIGKNAFPKNKELLLRGRAGLSSPVRKYAKKHKLKFEKTK